jgi:hypothetical protein
VNAHLDLSVAHLSTAVATRAAAHPSAATSSVPNGDLDRLTDAFRVILTDPQVDPRRLDRAARLLDACERTTTPGLWLVRSASRADLAHHVRNGACSCEDAQSRDPRRCCHALAVQVVQLLERMETDAEQLDAEAEIPYELTPRALAALDPTRECAGCDDQAQDHDGPAGQCTRHGADAEGWWACDCQGFQVDDAA